MLWRGQQQFAPPAVFPLTPVQQGLILEVLPVFNHGRP
jgi:hypothetical protein